MASSKAKEFLFRHVIAFYALLVLFLLIIFVFVLPLPMCAIEYAHEIREKGPPTIFNRTEYVWTYNNCFYFCVVTLTTIGFGDMSPQTPGGRAYIILYAMAGLGIVASLISVIGSVFMSFADAFLQKIALLVTKLLTGMARCIGRRGAQEGDSVVSPPGTVAEKVANRIVRVVLSPVAKILYLIFFIYIYALIGAAIFSATEGWTYGEGLYFAFIACYTIGYGDYSPKSVAGRWLFSFYILLGIPLVGALLGFFGELMQARLKGVKEAAKKRRQELKEQRKVLAKSKSEKAIELENSVSPVSDTAECSPGDEQVQITSPIS